MSYGEDLQRFLADRPILTAGTIHCLLTLDCTEKRVLGMVVRGDRVSRDVAQTVVNFSNHRLVGLAPSEAETRSELRKHAFDHLVGAALGDLSAARAQASGLERQHRILRRKLVAMQSAGWVDTLLEPSGTGAARSPDDVQRELVGIEAELAEQPIDTATLDGQLAHIARTLAQPERHLRLEKRSLTLDAMGIRLEGAAAQGVPAPSKSASARTSKKIWRGSWRPPRLSPMPAVT